MPIARVLVSTALLLASTVATAAPVRVVEESLSVPEGMDVAEALAVVEDLSSVFAHYQPAVPRVPGVSLELGKEVVSPGAPVVVALPIEGAVFGRVIDERAQVTATSWSAPCPDGAEGLRIDLVFDGSSYNVARRVDRIEIQACPRADDEGALYIDTTGALFEGPLPRDPELNALHESIGATALQKAFLRQVPAVFDAVRETWEIRQTALSADIRPGPTALPR